MAGRQGTYGGMTRAVEAALHSDLDDGRVELLWVAGVRGKPGLNADITNATEATRMVADPMFELLGTNASSDDSSYNAEGGITLETDGADGDQVILLPHLTGNISPWTSWTWGSDQRVRWSAQIATEGNITNAIIWAGLKLTNTAVTATDANQVFFRYEDDVNGGEWQAVASIAGVDDAEDTDIAVAINTVYTFNIDIDASRIAKMYINGALVHTTGVLTNAVDFIPYIGVEADGAAAAKAITVRWQRISRVYA